MNEHSSSRSNSIATPAPSPTPRPRCFRRLEPLALLVFLAGCGTSSEEATDKEESTLVTAVNTPTGWQEVPPVVMSPPAAGDLDATSVAESFAKAAWEAQRSIGPGLQATNAPYLFGVPAESFEWSKAHPEGGENPWWGGCYFPNSKEKPCLVPVDKKVNYHWVGATTDSRFPGIDFKELLTKALADLSAQSGGFGWTFKFSSSQSTNEYGQLTSDDKKAPGLGVTLISYYTPMSSGVSCSAGPGGQYCFKRVLNQCPTLFNVNTMARSWGGLSLDKQKVRIVRMMKHEIGHCIGFDHLNGTEYLMYPYDNATPTSFPRPERTAAQDFVP